MAARVSAALESSGVLDIVTSPLQEAREHVCGILVVFHQKYIRPRRLIRVETDGLGRPFQQRRLHGFQLDRELRAEPFPLTRYRNSSPVEIDDSF